MSGKRGEVSCIILAGGKNTRMGREKAFLRIGERTIIEEQKDTLKKIFDEIIIVTNNHSYFHNLDVKVVKDIIPHCGPLGGLYSGLSVCSNIHGFLIGCDMPFPSISLINYMIKKIKKNDIVIPVSSRGLEPLFAIYSLNCLETIKRHLEMKDLKISNVLNYHRVSYVSPREVKKFDPHEFSFLNVNTPEEYEQGLKIWLKRKE
ncbi:MAG: molybdenum cofactor guanylyltransferase [Candidatus Aminicenantales bacterium]